jgi:fucose permease
VTTRPLGDDGPEVFTRDRLTFLTYGMAVVFGFTVAAMGPAMPLLREDLAISRTLGGLHFTAIALGSVLAGFIVERITRRWGRRPVMWWGGTGVAAGALLIGGGWHPAVTLPGALLAGAAGSAVLVSAQATLSDHHRSHRPVAITELNTAMSFGSVIPAVLIGALVAVGAGWRPAFVAPLSIWLLLVALFRSEAIPPMAPLDTTNEARRLPSSYWLYWAGFIPAVGAEWSVGAWGADYLVDVADTSKGSAALLMTAFFGAMLAGRLLGGRVADVIKPFRLLMSTTAVGLAGIILFWGSETTAPVVAGLLLSGLGFSMQFPMLMSLALGVASERSDLAAARVSIAAGGSVIVAPLTLGVIADQVGIRAAFGIAPGLLVLVVVLAALGRRAESRHQTSPAPST